MHTYDRISARASSITTIEDITVSVINEAIQTAIAPYTSRIKVQVACDVINRANASAIEVLPEPLSPTIPTDSPRYTVRSRGLSACT